MKTILGILLLSVCFSAEVILLDGKKHTGEIISQNSKNLILSTKYGEITLPVSDIASIEYNSKSASLGKVTENDELILIDGTVFEGEYVSINNAKVIFKPLGFQTSSHIEKKRIKLLKLSDGTIIYNNNSSSSTTSSSNHLNNAGSRLISFKQQYYTGFYISTLGSLIVLFSATGDEQNTSLMLVGSLTSLVGSIISLLSFSDVGIAGEELKMASQNLESN
tara:strand:+ start:68 stop:730 length:663 start_codon:yes stop_codon:yes gene_type:complete